MTHFLLNPKLTSEERFLLFKVSQELIEIQQEMALEGYKLGYKLPVGIFSELENLL